LTTNPESPTALSSVPTNPNLLSNAGFKLVIRKSPHINFFCQQVNIPALALNAVPKSNPFVKLNYTGDHIDYSPLAVTFRVDEELKNWLEIHDWIKLTGFPNRFQERAEIEAEDKVIGRNIESDISLFILSSHRNPKIEVIFRDCIPVSLTELEFDSTNTEVEYFEATAIFYYTSYKIDRVT